MWSYAALFDVFGIEPAYLGEGQTPLISRVVEGHQFFAKWKALIQVGPLKIEMLPILLL